MFVYIKKYEILKNHWEHKGYSIIQSCEAKEILNDFYLSRNKKNNHFNYFLFHKETASTLVILCLTYLYIMLLVD